MMEGKSIVRERSYKFSISVIEVYKILVNSRSEFIMSKQLLRSGTSIGANIREALNAESRADFIHKMGIAQKECDETLYWLDLLYESGYLFISDYKQVQKEAEELFKMIRSIILSSKQKEANKKPIT